MQDYSETQVEEFREMMKELDRPIETFGDIAVRLCELLSCDNCPVTREKCDKRTPYQKEILHYPCCEQLHNWLVAEAKKQ